MKIKVMYHSRRGNTAKVAEAIAKSIGVTAEAIPPAYPFENVELLFIGAGLYMGKIDEKVKDFIKTLNVKRVRNAAVFGTAGGNDAGIKAIKELLKEQGINVLEESFLCRGKFFVFFNRKHPDQKDLQDAGEFAGRIVKKLEK